MNKHKCLKEHGIPHLQPISQVGQDFKLFDYCITSSYCPVCNKVRVQRDLRFKKPRIFQKQNGEIPF